MISSDKIIKTVSMIQKENLDVRTVTMGLNLMDCRDTDIDILCRRVVNKRLAVSPAADVAAGFGHDGFVALAKALDQAARSVGVDFVGGYSAQVQKGASVADTTLIESLPEAMSCTSKVCSSINVASSRAGINMEAIGKLGEILLRMAENSKDKDGFDCAKLVIFSNQPEDNPFMADRKSVV